MQSSKGTAAKTVFAKVRKASCERMVVSQTTLLLLIKMQKKVIAYTKE